MLRLHLTLPLLVCLLAGFASCKKEGPAPPSEGTSETPQAVVQSLTIGLVADVGALPLVAAHSQAIFDRHHLAPRLRFAESSPEVAQWLADESVDVAMLPPAEALRPRESTAFSVLSVLTRNTGGVSLSPALWNALQPHLLRKSDGEVLHPIHADALTLFTQARTRSQAPVVFQITSPLSTDTLALRYWLKAADIASGADPLFHPSLHSARVILAAETASSPNFTDAGHAGSEWNRPDDFVTVIDSTAIVADLPSAVLAVRTEWKARHEDAAVKTVAALLQAGEWLDAESAHRATALEALLEAAGPEIQGRQGQRIRERGVGAHAALRFGDLNSATPDASSALWLLTQMIQWGHLPATMTDADLLAWVDEVLDRDLFDDAAALADLEAPASMPLPKPQTPVTAVIDGQHFHPQTPTAIVKRPRLRRE